MVKISPVVRALDDLLVTMSEKQGHDSVAECMQALIPLVIENPTLSSADMQEITRLCGDIWTKTPDDEDVIPEADLATEREVERMQLASE